MTETLAPPRPVDQPPFRPFPQKLPDIEVERRADGCIVLRSRHEPGAAPANVAAILRDRAAEHPDRPFLMQRAPGHGPWQGVTYGEAFAAARSIGSWLLDRGLGQDDAVMVLSANSLKHALVMLGCYVAGVPVAPISPAYSLLSQDHEKLRHCFGRISPKVVFAEAGDAFARAFATLRGIDPALVVVTGDGTGDGATALETLLAHPAAPAVDERIAALGHADIAKYLFTSGSTGMPKAVPQTHGMMCSLIAASEGLRNEEPDGTIPQGLEWMPWSHISAGNISFNGNMFAGGTLFLDEGRPIPGQFETTIKNLYEVSPAVFGSAPVAFAMLADAMERDPKLRASFFRNLRYMGYGGATLSQDLYERMQALAVAETGERIPMVTMYGATETQGVTTVHWTTDRVGLIGLPLPGITMKLVPNGDKLEVRVKGGTVMQGYLGDPERNASVFDEEGFYSLGDAARFLDENDVHQGLVFDGRVAEDFKLSSGTWVSVGTLRPELLAAVTPLAFDAVLVGQDKPFLAAMIWPSPAAFQQMMADHGADAPARYAAALREKIADFNAGAGGSSRRIERFAVLTDPPSLDAGEITDKGYVNQRTTIKQRAAIVDALFADPPGPGVLLP